MRTIGVSLPLVPFATGDVVVRAAWPPHVTLVGNAVVADDAVDAALSITAAFAARTPPLHGLVIGEAWFEPGASVLVDLLESPALHEAHAEVLTAFERDLESYALLLPTHARGGWHPHRTVTPGERPAKGDELVMTHVMLIEIEPAGLPGRAVILGRWPLAGT